MSEKIIDVTGKYRAEIVDIVHKLKQLEDGRIYEMTGAQTDGALATNIAQLKKSIATLISKIEYGKDSTDEQLEELFTSRS